MVKLPKISIDIKYLIASIVIIGAISCYIYYVFKVTPEELKPSLHNTLISSLSTLLTNIILAIIASVGLYFTYKSIQANTASAQRQATIQVVMDINADIRLQNTKNFIFLKGDKVTEYYIGLNSLIEPTIHSTEEDKDCYRAKALENEKLKDDVHYVLNRYEFIALGIRKKAFDEEIFKDLHYSNFKKLWCYTKPLIMSIRATGKIDTIYQELEGLMKKWEANPIKRLK